MITTDNEYPTFLFDEFAQEHLRDWFHAGRAPFDWYLEDLDRFATWISANTDDIPENASWSGIVAQYGYVA